MPVGIESQTILSSIHEMTCIDPKSEILYACKSAGLQYPIYKEKPCAVARFCNQLYLWIVVTSKYFLVCSLMSFNKCFHLCSRPSPSRCRTSFTVPKSSPVPSTYLRSLPLLPTLRAADGISVTTDLLSLEYRMQGIIRYAAFCVWFFT